MDQEGRRLDGRGSDDVKVEDDFELSEEHGEIFLSPFDREGAYSLQDLFEDATNLFTHMVGCLDNPVKVNYDLQYVELDAANFPWSLQVRIQEGILTENGIVYKDVGTFDGAGVDVGKALEDCLSKVSERIHSMQSIAKKIDDILPIFAKGQKAIFASKEEKNVLKSMWSRDKHVPIGEGLFEDDDEDIE